MRKLYRALNCQTMPESEMFVIKHHFVFLFLVFYFRMLFVFPFLSLCDTIGILKRTKQALRMFSAKKHYDGGYDLIYPKRFHLEDIVLSEKERHSLYDNFLSFYDTLKKDFQGKPNQKTISIDPELEHEELEIKEYLLFLKQFSRINEASSKFHAPLDILFFFAAHLYVSEYIKKLEYSEKINDLTELTHNYGVPASANWAAYYAIDATLDTYALFSREVALDSRPSNLSLKSIQIGKDPELSRKRYGNLHERGFTIPYDVFDLTMKKENRTVQLLCEPFCEQFIKPLYEKYSKTPWYTLCNIPEDSLDSFDWNNNCDRNRHFSYSEITELFEFKKQPPDLLKIYFIEHTFGIGLACKLLKVQEIAIISYLLPM